MRWLEGVSAKIEIWPGRYERVMAQCLVHSKCEAQRAFSARFAERIGCGAEEPFCFLGVWLRRAAEFTTAGKHKEFRERISVEEERAYALEHGWPLTAPKAPAARTRRRKK